MLTKEEREILEQENPFLAINYESFEKVRKPRKKSDEDTFASWEDTEAFTKTFRPYKAVIKLIKELPNGAKDLWRFLELKTERDSAIIEYNVQGWAEELSTTRQQVNEALNALARHKVIVRKMKPKILYINDMFMFNGDRSKLYKDFINRGGE